MRQNKTGVEVANPEMKWEGRVDGATSTLTERFSFEDLVRLAR
jgi:hypothetical protein